MGEDVARPGSDRGSALDAFAASDAVPDSFDAASHHEANEHIALLYESREELLGTGVPFLRQGLDRGEKCVYVVDDSPEGAVVGALRAEGVDVAAARESGALTVLTREEYVSGTFTPESQIDVLAERIERAAAAHPAIRVAVEMTCFLTPDLGFPDLVRYEREFNAVSVDADVVALCQYNRNRFPADVLRDVVRAHPHLVVGDTFGHNVYYTPPGECPDAAPSREVERMTATLADLAATETELRRRTERAEAFASVLSHDLRNPLNVARGRLELARREHDSDHLDAVAAAHDRMEELVESLLVLTRGGTEVDDPGPVDLASVAERCWRSIPADGATLAVETDLTVLADRSRLHQLLENLVSNSVEHGGEAVTVRVGDLDRGFYVEDDGPGIPAGKREAVFEGGYSTTDGGTGLGLSIVERIADAHGWRVDAAEGSQGGARFEITGVETP